MGPKLMQGMSVLGVTLALFGAAGSTWAQQPPAPVVGPGAAVENRVSLTLDEAVTRMGRGDWLGAVEAYGAVLNVGAEEPRGQARFGLAVALSQLGREEEALKVLEGTLRDGTPLGLSVGLLRARLLLQVADKVRYTQGLAAADYVRQYDRLPDRPDQARRQRLQTLLGVAQPANQMTPKTLQVAVLVPQSGALAAVGQDVVRGLWLGLQELDATGMQVRVYDIAGAGGPGAAAERALREGAEVMIGPMLADDVRQAAPMAAAAGVPLLALTSDRQVLGQGVHTLNYLPYAQGAAMAQAAVAKGHTRVGGLIPRNAYGSEVWKGFEETARAASASVQPPAYFAPQAVDLGASIRELVGARATNPSATLPFEALLVPAGPATLQLALAQLAYHRAGNVPLLGTALWQDSQSLTPGLRDLRGGQFATPVADAGLREAFTLAYGRAPHPLAALGYDAARVLAELRERPDGVDLRTALLRPEGFFSSAGFIRFMADGSTQRGLASVRVVAGGSGSQFETVHSPLVLPPLPVPNDLRPKGGQGWRF